MMDMSSLFFLCPVARTAKNNFRVRDHSATSLCLLFGAAAPPEPLPRPVPAAPFVRPLSTVLLVQRFPLYGRWFPRFG